MIHRKSIIHSSCANALYPAVNAQRCCSPLFYIEPLYGTLFWFRVHVNWWLCSISEYNNGNQTTTSGEMTRTPAGTALIPPTSRGLLEMYRTSAPNVGFGCQFPTNIPRAYL